LPVLMIDSPVGLSSASVQCDEGLALAIAEKESDR